MTRILMLFLMAMPLLMAAASDTTLEPLASDAFIPEELPKTGYYKDVYKDPITDVEIMKYCIRAPDVLPDRRRLILIVDFHGCGGNEESFKWTKTNYPGIDDSNIMWLGMKAMGRCWADGDHDRITKCLKWVIARYPVDERRIIFKGFSSGAFLQRSYGARRQDLVAGIIQYAGGGPVPAYGKDSEQQGTEFYLTCGEKDDIFNRTMKGEMKSLNATGHRYVYRFWDQHDHTSHFNQNDPEVSAVSEDVIHWLLNLRHKTRGLYAEQLAFLKMAHKMDPSEFWNDQADVKELIRIGGREAGAIVLQGLKSKEAAIQAAAIDACLHVNMGKSVTTMLAKLYFKSKDEHIRKACGEVLCRLVHWRHATAQLALCEKIQDKKSSAAEKVQAIGGIKRCVEYQLFGTYRADLPLFKALVVALQDAEREVRTAAFDALKPCHDDAFGFDPALDKKENKAAIRAWMKWFGDFVEQHKS